MGRLILLALTSAGLIAWLVHEVEALQMRAELADAYQRALLNCMNAGSTNGRSTIYFPDTREAFECRATPVGKV